MHIVDAEHSFLQHAVNCGRFCFWCRQSVFLFVYEISREPRNEFAPNSHGRRPRSLARTSLKVKVKVTRDKKAFSTLSAAYVWFMFGKTSLASSLNIIVSDPQIVTHFTVAISLVVQLFAL